MVFSSIPSYLDPSNWQQQQNPHIIGGSTGSNPLFPPPPPPPHGGGGSIRPGSMAERARMANIPMPETPLNCPRCDSTNTKFCYFNNYSLSQPRHFCKTCRRYWTRGGALRNVPVGGGCRRNKRTKSKSPASSDGKSNPTSTTGVSTAGPMLQFPPLRFMPPLSQLSDGFAGDMGLNYSGMTAPAVGTNEMNFQGATNFLGGGGMASFMSSEGGGGGGGSIEQWRLQQQFPFFGGLEASSAAGVYQFHHGGETGFTGGEASHQVRPEVSETASVKMENKGEQRQVFGNEQWNAAGASWTELSSFSSSSTSNPL